MFAFNGNRFSIQWKWILMKNNNFIFCTGKLNVLYSKCTYYYRKLSRFFGRLVERIVQRLVREKWVTNSCVWKIIINMVPMVLKCRHSVCTGETFLFVYYSIRFRRTYYARVYSCTCMWITFSFVSPRDIMLKQRGFWCWPRPASHNSRFSFYHPSRRSYIHRSFTDNRRVRQ